MGAVMMSLTLVFNFSEDRGQHNQLLNKAPTIIPSIQFNSSSAGAATPEVFVWTYYVRGNIRDINY